MLSENTYEPKYVEKCRSQVDALVAAYRAISAASKRADGVQGKKLPAAVGKFEPQFFNNMVLALDRYFCHRSRTLEAKDGNPLNEVRVLCNSVAQNDGIFCVEKVINYDPAKSVLGLEPGDRVALSEADFSALSTAFFDELERKFT